MVSDTPIELYGAKSGIVHGVLNDLALRRDITVNGDKFAFRNIFNIRPATWNYIMQPFVRPGDSGAWIVERKEHGTTLEGMLFAGDGSVLADWINRVLPACALNA